MLLLLKLYVLPGTQQSYLKVITYLLLGLFIILYAIKAHKFMKINMIKEQYVTSQRVNLFSIYILYIVLPNKPLIIKTHTMCIATSSFFILTPYFNFIRNFMCSFNSHIIIWIFLFIFLLILIFFKHWHMARNIERIANVFVIKQMSTLI